MLSYKNRILPYKNRCYILLSVACLAGYIWLFYNLNAETSALKTPDGCLIKQVTNIPCPSCGSTRAIISLMHGDISTALYTNPLGLIVAGFMIILPLWLLYDLATRKNTLFYFYGYLENQLRKRAVAIPLITLIIINWVWNITKGL